MPEKREVRGARAAPRDAVRARRNPVDTQSVPARLRGADRALLAASDVQTRGRVVGDLQRTAGNQAVRQRIAPRGRQTATGTTRRADQSVVQRQPKRKPALKKTPFDRAELELIKSNAEARHQQITTFISESRSTLRGYQDRLLSAATLYRAAFDRHKAVLKKAGETAADRPGIISTIAQLAVGVALGVPGTLVRLGVSELAKRAALAAAATSELVELGVGTGLGWLGSGPPQSSFEPTAEIPELKELEVWRTLAEMRDKLLKVSLLTAGQMVIVSGAGTVISEVRLREGGAANLEKSDAQLQSMIAALRKADSASSNVTLALEGAKQEIDGLGANRPKSMSVDEVEQEIWIEWIADLTDDDLLDEDDITDHLEGLGVIGKGRRFWDDEYGEWVRQPPRLDVDFGSWVSDADERDAVDAARAKLGRPAKVPAGSYSYDDE